VTKSSDEKLAYQREYNAKPENVRKREANNKARAMLLREGKVKIGDGKDVAHIRPLNGGGTDNRDNLEVRSEKSNRGWRKGRSGYDVGIQK
jgi:hypothetical protein